jgi:hypothetical protein
MKRVLIAFTVALLIGPLTASAQDAAPLSRAQVQAEMTQYYEAGFNPARANPRTWVDDVQKATAKVAAQSKSNNTSQLAQTASTPACK